MTILMTGGDRPLGGYDFDEEDDTCPECGTPMEWSPCHMIDCEEGNYDLYEEDPINYDPGTYAACSECDGEGGSWYCPKCSKA